MLMSDARKGEEGNAERNTERTAKVAVTASLREGGTPRAEVTVLARADYKKKGRQGGNC